ncbi:MAG: formate dehydrogenase accessory sulfurtransferase FdhD [Acidobacteriota bacterium]|nr:MAG: formate dehydrogenase accessory sulfurtransferase FdhD [Acidobacteriota bacterium]
MNGPEKPSGAVTYVEAHRISTGGEDRGRRKERIGVALEAPLTIDVEGVGTYTVLGTPDDKRALALGFLFSEGLIDGLADVGVLRECGEDPDTVRVRLAGEPPREGERGRNLLIVSSCGACGSEELRARLDALPPIGDAFRIEGRKLRSVYDSLRKKQTLFDACGCTHAAGIFDAEANILSCAEDIGRHNALDKAIGKCLLEGIPTAGRGAALSGRVSLEMIAKCVRAGIELITAVSAPTALAIDVASRCNVTLCAFVRETRATVFTHPGRVVTEPPPGA